MGFFYCGFYGFSTFTGVNIKQQLKTKTMKTTNNNNEQKTIQFIDNISKVFLTLCFVWLFAQIINFYIY